MGTRAKDFEHLLIKRMDQIRWRGKDDTWPLVAGPAPARFASMWGQSSPPNNPLMIGKIMEAISDDQSIQPIQYKCPCGWKYLVRGDWEMHVVVTHAMSHPEKKINE